MADLLSKIRKKADLSQSEVVKRIGMSHMSGYSYISYLETGIKKNPSLVTILHYLQTCGANWKEFFSKLEELDLASYHKTS
jgi:transcriptional regulator with XRE-family HTH domain